MRSSFFTNNKKKIMGNSPHFFIWILAIIILVASGEIYRLAVRYLERIAGTAVNLSVSLSNFPYEIDNWEGHDLEIPTMTREYMERNFADDYVSRRYVESQIGAWADVYVVYCSTRPGGMVGHQPLVCYPGSGWIHDDTRNTQFTTQNGKVIKCLIHRFHKPAPEFRQTIVLNFYVVNGHLAINENVFKNSYERRFNLAGNTARYVAQVQISSILESSILAAAKEFSDLILDFLPDENGNVVIAE
jgi:hypothetical protein